MPADLPAGRRRPSMVGYTAGIFDLFHVGHLQLLREARRRCDYLIVGVTADELAVQERGRLPMVPLAERTEVVDGIRFVDRVVPQLTSDLLHAWTSHRFDVLFVAEHHRGRACWARAEEELADVGAHVVYLPGAHRRSGELLARGFGHAVAD